jgi:hypothetical protein
MDRGHIPKLAEVLDTYYKQEEVLELARLFEIQLEDSKVTSLGIARRLIEGADFAKHGLMLEAILDQAETRNLKVRTGPDWHIHSRLWAGIEELKKALSESAIPHEIAVSENQPFSAKSEVRGFLEKAGTPILIVGPYVGIQTLDCLRSVKHPVRILTGTNDKSIEDGFGQGLTDFREEGFSVEVRRHAGLHDRHIAFNDRCWLVGSSLKHAGQKAFHVMEIVDAKADVLAGLETKWEQGTAYPR